MKYALSLPRRKTQIKYCQLKLLDMSFIVTLSEDKYINDGFCRHFEYIIKYDVHFVYWQWTIQKINIMLLVSDLYFLYFPRNSMYVSGWIQKYATHISEQEQALLSQFQSAQKGATHLYQCLCKCGLSQRHPLLRFSNGKSITSTNTPATNRRYCL